MKLRRLLSLALSLCMLLSLAAFQGAAAETKDLVNLTMYIDHTWYPVESFTGVIPDIIREKTGVEFDVTVALNTEQLGVMLASGELPDIVYTQTMIDRFSDPTVCYSIEELIAQYCPDWEVSEKQLGIARTYSEDGVAYTLLNHFSEKKDWEGVNAVPMVGSLTIRGDILDALGEKQPTSFDELFELFGKVKAAYPNIVPLKLNEQWNTLVLRYLNGISQLEFVPQEDGRYVHFSLDPRFDDMLLWLNKCYNAGYIVSDDPFFVRGSTAIADDMYFATCGCTQNQIGPANARLKAINPDAYLIEMVPFAESDYRTSDVGWSAAFITRDCKDPEAAIKMLRWMFSEEGQKITQMGREGIEYTLDENGMPIFSDDWKETLALGSAAHNSKYNTWFYLGGSEIVEAISRCATTDPAWVADTYAVIRERFDNLPWVMAALPKGESDEKIIYDKIEELRKDTEKKIIMAPTPEDAQKLYDEYVQRVDQMGMKDLEDYMNTTIVEMMPMFQ